MTTSASRRRHKKKAAIAPRMMTGEIRFTTRSLWSVFSFPNLPALHRSRRPEESPR
jgi:hypothetical protein